MKRFTAIVLAVFMMLCSLNLSFASGDLKLDFNNAQLSGLTLEGGEIKNIERKNYLYFPGVDLTGINSVTVRAYNKISGNVNGETLLVLIDSHTDGKMIGSVTLSEVGEDVSVTASLTPTSGKHDLYFYCLYGKGTRNECSIKEITLSENTYNHDNKSMQVSDSFIIDNYSDTWVAVDDMGRAVATYEEVGGVKTDGRTVGMLYWNWFHDAKNTKRAHVISDVIAEKPGAKEIYTDPVWDVRGRFYWAEPLFGFYNSYDYWVYKKHAEMLAIAGVDVIFFDYTNGGRDYIPTLNVLAEAFREIKAKGVKVPKISAMMTLSGDKSDAFRGLSAIYYNCFKLNDYSDLWYMKDGKPFLYANANYENAVPDVEEGNNFEGNLIKEIGDFFTVTPHGSRDKDSGDDSWMWLENYPQVLRDVDKETGRVGFVAVGCAINESTVFGGSVTGVFSDPYNKGRGYSEAFGEDYSENGKRMAYFFREQSALALMAEPEFMMVDGWNEWTAERNPTWGTFTNAFCDCFDEENSRDFEPTKGSLKDDYYLLLCDLVRKYKGVRPAPVASGMKTIDISGNINEWDGVLPYFINSYQDYERDADGYGKAKTDETWHYTTKVVNSIKGAKVSFDGEKLYFMVECEKDIVKETENLLTLYINSDRNAVTGWEGYDYAVNLDGIGKVSKFAEGVWEKTLVGDAAYSVDGKYLKVAVDRNLIGETATVDLEFKWTDSMKTEGNILSWYQDGSVAPYGRFNYLYTEIAQSALTPSESAALSETSVLKAGSAKMIANGDKMYVYEDDIRVTPFEMNGTLYIPEQAYNEVMGYGFSKTRYVSADNNFFTYHFELNDDLTEIINYTWTYSMLESLDARVNGKVKKLSAPVKYVNGMFYIPLSLIAECYGYEVKALGNGVYTVSLGTTPIDTVNAVVSHLN